MEQLSLAHFEQRADEAEARLDQLEQKVAASSGATRAAAAVLGEELRDLKGALQVPPAGPWGMCPLRSWSASSWHSCRPRWSRQRPLRCVLL